MAPRPQAFFAVFALVLLPGCAHVAPSGEPRPVARTDLARAREAVDPIFREMFAAANAHDTDRHLAAYLQAPDVVFIINGEVIRGIDSLRMRQRQWWADGKSDVVYEIATPADYQLAEPGLVVQAYRLLSRRVVDGNRREGFIDVLAIWRQRAEGWRIVYARETTSAR